MYAALIGLIPLLAWYRWRHIPLDRDYTPYAYPAVFNTPYLGGGHCDIKPPLLHWSYKCWLKIISLTRVSVTAPEALRSLPALGMSLGSGLVAASDPGKGLVLALLLSSATLWAHMANTEWLTALLWALAFATRDMGALPWLFLGLTPWANQKNALLVPILAWCLSLPLTASGLGLLGIPSVVLFGHLIITSRGKKFLAWCVAIPGEFGKKRTFKRNVLSASRLLIPCLALLAPVIAGQDGGRWAWASLAYFALMLSSLQIVPHHFIGLAFLLAMGCTGSPAVILGLLAVWALKDGLCLWEPAIIYPSTFGGGNVHYGMMLDDGGKIAAIVAAKTEPGEAIWVNGMENNIYFQANRPAWRVEIPELPGAPLGEPPRYIVHCTQSAKPFDYDGLGYEPIEVSNLGLFTLMRRKA